MRYRFRDDAYEGDHVKEASAKIILDSVSPAGDRLVTMEVVLWRPLLAEFNTHRWSRNGASSRAIPIERQLGYLDEGLALPISWPAEQPGMQGGDELTGQDLVDAQDLVDRIYQGIRGEVDDYLESHPDKARRLHKSYISRYLEPFMWQTMIFSTTEGQLWNFFHQRSSHWSKGAQAEFRAMADAAYAAWEGSTPVELGFGDWHLPYIQPHEQVWPLYVQIPLSVARTARVSYLTHSGTRDLSADFRLFRKLVDAVPPHWSPLEHIATPERRGRTHDGGWLSSHSAGNFDGWEQLRHTEGAVEIIKHLLVGEDCPGADAFLSANGDRPAEQVALEALS